MPADGGGQHKGERDGVSGVDGPGEAVSGRDHDGESGGGAYPNPHTGHTAPMPHGWQPRVKHYGGSGPASGDGKPSPNAPDRPPEADAERTNPPPPVADRSPRAVAAGGRSFTVVEESGVAAAEASGAGETGQAAKPDVKP